jgi:phage portal protein BeeE
VLEIARAIGVDPEDLGVSTTSRTYQNSEQRRQDMLDFTFAAYRAAMEQRLSMRDVLPRGYEAKVNLDSFLRSDTLGRMQAYKIAEEVKALTEDEVRELEDRPLLTPAQRGAMTPPVPAPAPMQGVPNG